MRSNLVLDISELNHCGRGAHISWGKACSFLRTFVEKKFLVEKMTFIRYGGEGLVRLYRAEERGYIMGAKESPPDGMLGDGP